MQLTMYCISNIVNTNKNKIHAFKKHGIIFNKIKQNKNKNEIN